ncbi:neuronal PAS domain-containing protein 4A-like, partial [Penaeus japonicus]|uniref:neuronal PAS domain-containing protein 4A-like n=1 Tax=Penaeus japonicus TaxID=27405 RepID=UPI001C712DEB
PSPLFSFDGTKSTKGASKMRRDMINAEIGQLRDLLPLPPSTRQRLSQLQLMALVCVYVRKSNYFQQVFKQQDQNHSPTPNIGFSKAMNGFIMMLTQGGKLLYISDNAAEYLGHSMEDLLIHGDSMYDIIDKQDHAAVQAELVRGSTSASPHEEDRLFLCRMNVSRNARRQMRFGDQKVVLVAGHYLSYLPLCSRNEPVFLAHCTPVAMPETRESVVQGATNVFTSVHTLDMKFISLDRNGEFYLGYNRSSLAGVSWYHLIHPENMREAQTKHRLITASEQDRSCILLLRLQAAGGTWRWVHCVLQVKDGVDSSQQSQQNSQQSQQGTSSNTNGSSSGSSSGGSGQSQQPVIVATNQVLGEKEAAVLRANSWLYHYYTMQSKLQYGLAYDTHAHRVHAYYPQVMTYQTDPASSYMPATALNGSHAHSHTHAPAAHSPYSLASPSAYAHLQHYHHHYSVRLQHGLDYSRDPAWGYYDAAAAPPSEQPSAHHVNPATPTPVHTPAHTPRSSKKSASPNCSPRRSPSTPQSGHGISEGGGVAVATPVAVRAAPAGVHKGASSPELDQLEAPWKASPTQEVPDYPEYSPYITPPYSAATPTKHHVFSFEQSDPRDMGVGRDQRVPSVESGDLPLWPSDLPAKATPWLPSFDDGAALPLRHLPHAAL